MLRSRPTKLGGYRAATDHRIETQVSTQHNNIVVLNYCQAPSWAAKAEAKVPDGGVAGLDKGLLWLSREHFSNFGDDLFST